jgi:hypothetical protein
MRISALGQELIYEFCMVLRLRAPFQIAIEYRAAPSMVTKFTDSTAVFDFVTSPIPTASGGVIGFQHSLNSTLDFL